MTDETLASHDLAATPPDAATLAPTALIDSDDKAIVEAADDSITNENSDVRR